MVRWLPAAGGCDPANQLFPLHILPQEPAPHLATQRAPWPARWRVRRAMSSPIIAQGFYAGNELPAAELCAAMPVPPTLCGRARSPRRAVMGNTVRVIAGATTMRILQKQLSHRPDANSGCASPGGRSGRASPDAKSGCASPGGRSGRASPDAKSTRHPGYRPASGAGRRVGRGDCDPWAVHDPRPARRWPHHLPFSAARADLPLRRAGGTVRGPGSIQAAVPFSPPSGGGELTSAHPQVAWLERNEPGDKPPSSSKTRTWSSSLLGYRVMRVSTNPDLLKERHRDTMSIGSVKSPIGRHCSENLQNMRFFGALLQPYSV